MDALCLLKITKIPVGNEHWLHIRVIYWERSLDATLRYTMKSPKC